MFITDGEPNKDTPSEIGEYNYLKNKYPFIIVNAVQYEMGTKNYTNNISDNQFITTTKTLEVNLADATVNLKKYKDFVVSDYINDDRFVIEKEEDISVSDGTISYSNEN